MGPLFPASQKFGLHPKSVAAAGIGPLNEGEARLAGFGRCEQRRATTGELCNQRMLSDLEMRKVMIIVFV